MRSLIGSVLAFAGIVLAAAAMSMVLLGAGLTGGTPSPGLTMVAAGGFLLGALVFGLGLGRRTGY